jgi:hypothetical protein
MRSENIISNWYEVQRNLFTSVVREHIFANLHKDAIIWVHLTFANVSQKSENEKASKIIK